MKVAELVAENLEAESDAIGKYLPLIEALEEANDHEGADIVREIVGDEKNHLNLLQVILMKHDGGIKIAEDDMKESLSYLQKNLTD